MSNEPQSQYEDVSAEFNFGVDDLREEGYKFKGRIVTAEIRRRPDETFNYKDGSGSFTVKAHDEVNIWAVPLVGRNGEEPKARPIIQAPFTNNLNSKDGFFRSESSKAIDLPSDIRKLVGRVFDFELIEHKKFGRMEAKPFFVIRGEDKGAAGVENAQTRATPSKVDWDTDGPAILGAIDGHEASGLLNALTAAGVKSPTIISAAVSGDLLREGTARGLIAVVDGKIRSSVGAAA